MYALDQGLCMPRRNTYEAWKEVRSMGIRAFRTYLKMPMQIGPSKSQGFWPIIPRSYWEAYDMEAPRLKVRPSPQQISEAETFFGAVAKLPEADRHTIHTYLKGKLSRKTTIGKICRQRNLAYSTFHHHARQAFAALTQNPDLIKHAKSSTTSWHNRTTHPQGKPSKPPAPKTPEENLALARRLLSQQSKRRRR